MGLSASRAVKFGLVELLGCQWRYLLDLGCFKTSEVVRHGCFFLCLSVV